WPRGGTCTFRRATSTSPWASRCSSKPSTCACASALRSRSSCAPPISSSPRPGEPWAGSSAAARRRSGAGELRAAPLDLSGYRFGQVVGAQERRVPQRHVLEGLRDRHGFPGCQDGLGALDSERRGGGALLGRPLRRLVQRLGEVGRASCRDRVEVVVVVA